MNNWSRVGIIIGMLLSIGMYWRYFVIYSDTSQGLLYIGLGITIMAISWLYDVALRLEKRMEDLEIYIVDNKI